jgi:endoglucanase
LFRRLNGSVTSWFVTSLALLGGASSACSSHTSTASGSGANGSTSSSGGDGIGNGSASSSGGMSSQVGGAGGMSTGGMSIGGSSTIGAGGSVTITPPKEPLSKFIVVDQFGYRTSAEKIAVVRDPQTGFDSGNSFTPGKTYALVDAATGKQVLSAAATAWSSGATDTSSGDKAWWFDFSAITQPSTYYVLDVDNDVRSDLFDISDTVYREILKRAVRMLFYQRCGQAKEAEWAGVGWTDTADHVGPGQDHEARLFTDKTNASTAKDLWGGWFDAGDFNKYTNWTAGYVVSLLRAYTENPSIWRDDYEIPESGNGIPDVLDEAKWGMDYLTRLQNDDGSVLSIVGEASGSPPSTATDPSYYGPASTSATLSAAGAYALGATVFGSLGNAALTTYASDLKSRALKAWVWANANPDVQFMNNVGATAGLGAGQQETNDYGRLTKKLESSVYLFELTGDTQYRDFFDANYKGAQLFTSNNFAYPFENGTQEALLYYTKVKSATAATVSAIQNAYATGMGSNDNFGSLSKNADPYLAYLPTSSYTWGSNQVKSAQGLMFYDMITWGIDATKNADALRAAERYVHYVHGLNPLGFVYLSNMGAYGAANGVSAFYDTWFANGSALWDRVGVSTYGPAPGYLTGGPNPSYAVDSCCPSNCGQGNNQLCTAQPLSPPEGQPAQKSYKDFNDNWPIDSWQLTEPDDGYQVSYIRLLSKFVK